MTVKGQSGSNDDSWDKWHLAVEGPFFIDGVLVQQCIQYMNVHEDNWKWKEGYCMAGNPTSNNFTGIYYQQTERISHKR